MSLIVGENVSHSYGPQQVLRDVTFRVSAEQRIGLVGPNGEGKTTLLKIIGGLMESTLGDVHRRRNLRVGYLPQSPPAMEGTTIYEAMLDVFADLRAQEDQLNELAAEMGDDDEKVKLYGQLQAQFEGLGGYDYTTRIRQVLTGLAFARDMWDRPLGQLSGGERTRVYLATLLLREPDVLMLDEPTNHLDLEAIEWLEFYLKSFKGALLVVSHDRYFLDNITDTTWEVAFGGMETYKGPYSEYLKKRDDRYKERLRQWDAQQEYIAKTQEFIARHLYGQRTKEAQGRRTRLERYMRDEAVEKPRRHGNISLALEPADRSGDIVFRAENLHVGYEQDKPLLKIEHLEVDRADRIAIVGPNGTGKTTLLRTLLGQLKPLDGSVRTGAAVHVGYLSQIHDELEEDLTAMESVQAVDHRCTAQRARSLLGALQISGDESQKPVSQLSGGQRSRVLLARLVQQNTNVLMLDEPTNHLDIPSTEIMQDVLQRFDGTVLFVSHDRYLVQAVATHIWAIDGGVVKPMAGGWDSYLQWRGDTAATVDKADANRQSKEERKAGYREAKKQSNLIQRLKRRHQELETEIDTVEQQLAVLNKDITAAGESGDMELVETLGSEYQTKDTHLKELWTQWEQVGEQLE